MANRIEITKLQSGSRYIVIHVYLESDGASGNVTDLVLLDPATDGGSKYVLEAATWNFSGFNGLIHAEELVDDKPLWVLPADGAGRQDFTDYGGVLDRSTEGTGRILFSTKGFPAGSIGSAIIKARVHS